MAELPRHPVTVDGRGQVLEVPEGADLREALLRAGLPLYGILDRVFHCGGRGRCRTCRIRVVAGSEALSPPTPFERRGPGLAPGERLACQTAVRGPARIALPRVRPTTERGPRDSSPGAVP